MSQNETIRDILDKHPELTEPQILAELEAERERTAGLIADATLLRVIAARYGVTTLQQPPATAPKLFINHLVPNLNRITVSGRIVAIFPTKTFEGEKPGKYASLMIADRNGVLRVILWNGKAELVESGTLKVGQVARFLRGYTKQDLNGRTELHISDKSNVEVDLEGLAEDYPFIEQFVTTVKDIAASNQNVHLKGKAKASFPSSTFTRTDGTEGKVLRFFLSDATGDVMVVAWNEKAEKLEREVQSEVNVKLVNAKIKAVSSGNGLEVHVDDATYVELSSGTEKQ